MIDLADEAVLGRLAAAVPFEVLEACKVLSAAGHQAVTVGGAVRDAILGRPAKDWDVASSARPEEVQALFPRTIPTGIAHGTITVMVGRGERRLGVEVTTFRGEGAYSDARRPDSVVFGVPLVEDLARRDLVVNAIAYDPVAGVIHDPFDGRGDLARRRLRAVGDPVARFTEDGLRVMRAIRFAAVLRFALDEATEAAIPAALPSLAKVSRERVHDELAKLLAAPVPSEGLVIARRTGVLAQILAEVAHAIHDDAVGRDPSADGRWARLCARVDAAPVGDGGDITVRLGALLADLGGDPVPSAPAQKMPVPWRSSDEHVAAKGDGNAAKLADAVIRRLKGSNEERDRVVKMVRIAGATQRSWTAAGVRRLLHGVGRAAGADVVAVWTAEAVASSSIGDADGAARALSLAAQAQAILEAGHPLASGDLAVGGGDVMALLGIEPGRVVGQLIEKLLERVLEDPSVNERATLERILRELHP